MFQIDAFATAETDVSAPGDVSSAAFAGFSITSITLTDAQGNLIAGVPYLSESGTAYLQDEVLVPEPGTWLLLFGGLFMLVINRGRRVQSAEFTKQRRQCSTLLGSLGSTWPLILEFIFSKNFPTNATDQWFQTNTAHDIF